MDELTAARDIEEFERNIKFARPLASVEGFNVHRKNVSEMNLKLLH